MLVTYLSLYKLKLYSGWLIQRIIEIKIRRRGNVCLLERSAEVVLAFEAAECESIKNALHKACPLTKTF